MRFDFHRCEFEAVHEAPEKLAVAGSDHDLSWAELAAAVARFEELFRRLAIPPGHPVLLRGHKEAHFPAAMLAAVRLGLPYVPIDVLVPPARVARIRQITGSQVAVHLCPNDIALDTPIAIDGRLIEAQRLASISYDSANRFWFPDDPVFYIMFTSGSTGEPKGVQITRGAIQSFLGWMEHDYGFEPTDRFINQAPFSFDLSVYELMSSLHLGGSLILSTAEGAKNPAAFLDRIRAYAGSVWVSTPSFVYLFLLEPSFIPARLPALETFLFCGEELPNRTARKLLELFPGCRVLNSYGPTEATVSTTLVAINLAITRAYPSLPLGYPKCDSEILIENESNDPSEPGEVIIVGDNVSIGYLGNPELTAEKFFRRRNRRAYRTGDFGYFKDGMLFFTGRRDEQVKLHGYRIELGDISAQICAVGCVDHAVTVPLRMGGAVKRIVSFATLKPGIDEAAGRGTILAALRQSLPGYMIPGDLRIVPKFPYTTNNKIDKQQLIDRYLAASP